MREKAVLMLDLIGMREEAGLGHRKAAKMVGIDDTTYERLEAGGIPSLANALKMARFMQMPVEEIWRLEEEEEEPSPKKSK